MGTPARPLVLALVLALAPPASASPCTSVQPESGAPIRITPGPAELGSIPEACPANEVALRGWGAALIAKEDYYGSLDAGSALRFRMAHPDGPWLSLFMPGIEYRFVANATVEGEGTEMSAGSLSGHLPIALGPATQLAPFARVLLPTETVYRRATRFGFDGGTSGVWRIHRVFEATGGVSLPLLLTVNRPTTHVVFLPSAGADALFEPWRFFSVGAGALVRLRAGNDPGFEAFEPRATLRFYAGPAVLDLAAAMPLFGQDRTDLLLSASLGLVGW